MSHPFRANICGECGRPHEPPPMCSRCGNRPDAPLLGRAACGLCLVRAAPRLAMRALRATTMFVLWTVGLVVALYVAAAAGAFWIFGGGLRSRQRVAFDPLAHGVLYADEAITELEQEAALATIPPQPSFGEPPPPPDPSDAACPRYFSERAAPRILSALGKETRDPHALLARASRLAAAGFDVSVSRTALAPGIVERVLSSASKPSNVIPVRFNGGVAGVCLEGLGRLPVGTGLRRGDIITSINGVPIVRPDLALEAYESATRAGMAVLEILRGERRVVLAVVLPAIRPGAGAGAAAGSASAAAP